MRRFTRLALAALAAIGASGALVAAPAASWTNFGGGITNGSTTTHYGSTVNTATVTGGTWNAEGGYLQLGDATTPTPTDGTITLQLPATITSATAITVMLDVADLPTGAASLITVALSNSKPSACLKTTSTGLQQVTGGTEYGNCEYGSALRSPRQMIAFAYNSGVGTNTIIDGVQRITNTGLKYGSQTPTAVTIGAVRGMKVYGIYLYASQLSAAQVATEMVTVRSNIAPALSVSMTRNDAANANSIKVATLRQGATSTVADFTATFGSSVENATAARNSANGSEAATFFKDSWNTLRNENVKDGYPMVCNKFLNANSDYYWRLWLPITLETTDTFNDVLPELYPTTSNGEDQGTAATFFNYTISLYEGTVTEGTTAEPIATATGTTSSTKGLNTTHATLSAAISGRSGEHTLKIEVTPNACGNGAYSGIRSVQFFNRTTASRTVSGKEGTWSSGWTDNVAPVFGSDVTLRVSDAATLSMDTAATLSSLTVNDGSAESVTPSLTFTGEQSLISSATTLNVSTDVSDITASLGAVTLASGKTLTVGKSSSLGSLSGTDGTVVVDAKAGSIAYDATATMLEIYRTYRGKVIFKGAKADAETSTAATGVTLPYAIGKGTMSAKFAFDGGTHSFQYGVDTTQVLFGPQGTDDNPTIEVKNGATLDFCMKDLSGWIPQPNAEKVVLRVREGSTEGSTLKFTKYNNDTAYFNNRIVLDNNATVDIKNPDGKFQVNGGVRTAETAQLAMLGGETETVANVKGNSITLASDQTPKGMGVSVGKKATLTIANAIVGNSECTFAKYGAGTLVLSGTFTTSPITVDAGVLGFSVESGERTVGVNISGAGTVKKLGAGTLSLTGAVSTPVELAEGTLNLGTRRPAVTVTGEGTTLKLTLTPDEALTGRAAFALAPTLGNGITSYTLAVSFCGEVKNATVSASGTATFPAYDATSTGTSWWWDYEFNGNVSNSGSDGTGLTQDGAAPVYDNGTALKLQSTPYRSVTYPDEFTAVMYAKAGTTPYGGLLAFGTKTDGAISLVCGAEPEKGQVRLIYSKDPTVTELISAEAMSVPNATTANHLYAFTKRTEDGNTVIDVYLDGRKLAHYVFSGAATIGGGFQVGSLHGGEIRGALVKASDENGTVDFLRVSNTALSDAAIAALAAAYPYTSPNGKATRTVTAADTAWSADGTWTEGTATVAAPTAGKVVELTANENASLAVALEADVSYESLKLSGTGTVALTRGEGTTGRVVVQGVTTVETDSTVDARAVKLTGLTIAEDKTLTIDCSGLVLLQDTYRLTGYIDETTFSRIEVILPSEGADTPFTFEAARDNTGCVVLRATAVTDLAATVSTDTAWASVLWTWEGHETPTALQVTSLGNATLTFANNAAISTPAALTVTGTLTASGTGSLDLPTGSTVASTQLSGSATLILHQSQANVVRTRSGNGGTFKFVGGTTAAPLVVPYDVDFPGAIAIAANSCVKLNRTISGNASYQVTGEGQSSIAIIANTRDGWGVLNKNDSVTSLFRNLTLSLGGSNNFWFRAGLTDNVWLDIQSGRTLKQEDDALNTNVGGVLTVRNLTGGGIFESLKANQTLRLLNTDAAASTFNAAPTINDGGTNFKLVFAGNWTVSAALTDGKTPPIIHIGDGSTATTVETAFAFAPGPAYTVQANATLRPTAAAAALPTQLTLAAGNTLAENGKVQLTLNTLTLPSALAGTGTVLFGNGTDTFAYTLASAPANFAGTYNVAENSTLTLTSAPNGNAGFAGSGTLVIGNGSAATNFTSTKAYPDATQPLTVQVKSPSKLTLNPGAGNFAFPNGVAFDVASGAELILASGMSFFGVSGEGSCSVTGDYVFGVSGTAASDGFPDEAKVLDVATLTVGTPTNTAVTLGIRPFGAIDIAPTTLTIKENVTVARNDYYNNEGALVSKGDASISLASGATLSGTGTIELPVAFTEGAVLDAVTAAPLLLKGKVTGPIKVKLDTAKAVLTTSTAAELDRNTQLAFADDETSQTFKTGSYRFAETVFNKTTHTFTVVPPLSLPTGLPEAVSGNEAAQDAIYDAVATVKRFLGYDITSVTAVTAESTGGVAGNVEALALFENLYVLATPVGEPSGTGTYAGTVTVYYDFGISEMRVKSASLVNAEDPQLYVLLCAKVATTQNTSTANYATGTIVTLYKGEDTPVNTALTLTNEQLAALGIRSAAGEKWFAVPVTSLDTGTNAFKVRATQTPATP